MKIVIPGGTGQLGSCIRRAFAAPENEIVILSRTGKEGTCLWDGKNPGPWTKHIDGSDVVINLAGRTVNCRYTSRHLHEMMVSRTESTRIVGEAIEHANSPPAIWLQMSTATIYSHRFDKSNDEINGEFGGDEPDVPTRWKQSIEIAKAWEQELWSARTPATRKVALRSAMVMSPDPKGVFDVLVKLVRARLGGTIGHGRQFVSWIHESDYVSALRFIIEQSEISGAVNLASPCPLPQREFMHELRKAQGVRFGLPATKWMVEAGAFVMRTDTELVLKSRRVEPRRLLDAGFQFQFARWHDAAVDLTNKARASESRWSDHSPENHEKSTGNV